MPKRSKSVVPSAPALTMQEPKQWFPDSQKVPEDYEGPRIIKIGTPEDNRRQVAVLSNLDSKQLGDLNGPSRARSPELIGAAG